MKCIGPLILAIGVLFGFLGCGGDGINRPVPEGSAPPGKDGGTAVVTRCETELARVQTLCAGNAFSQSIGGLCASNADCVATCLADNIVNVDTCAQIDCYFCPVCDCDPRPPTPLRTCLATCPAR